MSNNPLVSVIVPVYGVEKYIDKCIKSIVSQTYNDLEIILVDDASVDGSGKKCDEWALKDKRIVVEHKTKNAGLNMARKTGFDVSHGAYVTFVDSDDFLHEEYISKLHDMMLQKEADIAVCGYVHFNDGTQESTGTSITDQEDVAVYPKDEMIKKYLTAASQWPHTGNPANAHCKLFKRSIIEAIDWKLSDYSVGEDDFMSLQFYSMSSKSVVTNDKLYFYRINPTSLSSSKKYGYKQGSKSISPFQLCDDYYRLAAKLLGEKLIPQIRYKTYTMYMYYVWNAVNKECLSVNDIELFDKIFPVDSSMADGKYEYDKDVLSMLEESGLLGYVLNKLRADVSERDEEIARLSSVVVARDKEVARLSSELSAQEAEILRMNTEFASTKRAMKLVIGNAKRSVAKRTSRN